MLKHPLPTPLSRLSPGAEPTSSYSKGPDDVHYPRHWCSPPVALMIGNGSKSYVRSINRAAFHPLVRLTIILLDTPHLWAL